jgi:ribosomal protein S27AE
MATTAEHQLEKLIYAEKLKDKTAAVIQEKPICPHCLEVINIMSNKVTVAFVEIKVGEKTYRLAEPVCPLCGEVVAARYHIVQ